MTTLPMPPFATTLLDRAGTTLAVVDTGPGETRGPAIVFIHGWACDLRFLTPLITRYAGTHRVIAPDLRGHGMSGDPTDDLTIIGFADDLVWQLDRLGVHEAVLVGHSMGGSVALEVAAMRPGLISGVIMIDTVLFPPPAILDLLRDSLASMVVGDFRDTIRRVADLLFIEADDTGRKRDIVDAMTMTRRRTAISALSEHVAYHTGRRAPASVAPRLAYVSSTGLADLQSVADAFPAIVIQATTGVGHFSPLLAPEQLVTIIDAFLKAGA